MRINSFLSLVAGLGMLGLGGVQMARAQEIRGKLMRGEQPVTDVHVMNTTAKKATISDAEGNFAITARVNDTLLFSAVQLKRKSLVVTTEMLQSPLLIVPMEAFVNELDEVVVRPFDLSGDLTRDMQNLPTGQVVSATSAGLPNIYVKPPTQAQRKLHEATTGGGIVPLNPIFNAISGRTKYLKKVLKSEQQYARTNRVREFYADSLFVRDLKIPLAKIDDFMYFCEVDPSFNEVVDTRYKIQIW